MQTPLLTKSIIDVLGLQKLPEEKKQALVAQMSDVVQSRISHRINDQLSPANRQAFDLLLSKNPSEGDMNAFLSEHVPNVQLVVNEEILKFKQEMAQEVASMKSLMA